MQRQKEVGVGLDLGSNAGGAHEASRECLLTSVKMPFAERLSREANPKGCWFKSSPAGSGCPFSKDANRSRQVARPSSGGGCFGQGCRPKLTDRSSPGDRNSRVVSVSKKGSCRLACWTPSRAPEAKFFLGGQDPLGSSVVLSAELPFQALVTPAHVAMLWLCVQPHFYSIPDPGSHDGAIASADHVKPLHAH